MATSSDYEVFYARCLRVAAAATAAGASFRKSERGRPTLEVSGNGKTIAFPIVTDDRAWKETTPEEALYSVLVDAREWSGAKVDDASIATLVDDVERAELPLIKKDLSDELARIAELSEILGGRANLNRIWETVDVSGG